MKETILKKVIVVSSGKKAVQEGQHYLYTKKDLEGMTNLSAIGTKKVFLSSDLDVLDKLMEQEDVDFDTVGVPFVGTVIKAYIEKNTLYIDVKLNDSKLIDRLGTTVSGGFGGTISNDPVLGEKVIDLKIDYFYLNDPVDDKFDAVSNKSDKK